AAQKNARVAIMADHEPVGVQLEVAIVFDGGEVETLAVGDDFALADIDPPVLVALSVPLGLLRRELLFGERGFRTGVIVRLAPAPSGKILAVEQGGEPFR